MSRQAEGRQTGKGLAFALAKHAGLGEVRLRGSLYLPTVVALSAVYFLAAKFGLSLAYGPEAISAVWPPSGIALASLLLFGNHVWPAITLGAFFANLFALDGGIAVAGGIAVGATLEACLGAFLLRRAGFQASLTRLRDVFALVGLAALPSTAVGATVGVTVLSGLLPDRYPWSQLPWNWLLWWVGDAMGELVVAPVLLTLGAGRRDGERPGRGIEGAVLATCVVVLSVVLLAGRTWAAMPRSQQRHVVFPLVLWAALRFGQRATTLTVLCVSAVAIWGVTHGLGPFAAGPFPLGPPNERLLLTQAFLAVVTVTGLVVGAVTAERRRAEQDRETLLAREQAARADAEERTAEIEAEARRKDEFLALLGHELRNPLAPMRNAVHLLKRPGRTEAVAERALAVIDRQITHMVRLVDDLLDLSRISHGKVLLRKRRLDLVTLAGTAAEEHRPALEAAGLTLETRLPGAPIWVDGDPTRLTQVIGNLLSNAAKFTPSGGHITVEVAPDPAENGVKVSVRDTGIGMEPHVIQHVFEPFVQADRSLDRGAGGLGLGLSLARGLVELHAGRIEAASAGAGRGSQLEIWLPVSAPPIVAGAHPAAPPRQVRPSKVLIIEDNVDAASSFRDLLQLQGHEVHVAHDGLAGMDVARRTGPDVIFCDIGLPRGMSGYDFAVSFRRDPETQPACLVAMTGYGTDEDKRRAIEAGFDLHLTKPAELAEVERILSEVVSRR